MEKETKSKKIVIGVAVVLLVLGAYYYGILSRNDFFNLEQKVNNKFTSVQVTKFYDGEWGYSLSIPEANKSNCVWTWVAGNGAIPDMRTTIVDRNAIEKHFVKFGDYIDAQWDYKVSCVDDFGSNYVGIFPIGSK